MARSKNRKKSKTGGKRSGRARTAIAIGLLSGLIIIGIVAVDPYAFRTSGKWGSNQIAPTATSGLTPSNPSKEYIHAGGRLVATEEPTGPSISGLNPDTVVAATGNTSLIVSGSGFQPGSVVRFNGSNRDTVYNNGNQLTATILASDISFAGLPGITVFNPGYGTSNVFTLTVRFSDVASGNIYYQYINKIADRRVTLGCNTGLYCPSDTVFRDQMAVFIERSLGVFNPPAPTSQRFQDVPPTHWAYAFIDDFATRGITQGCTATNYCPGGVVTHSEMAAFIVRALGVFNPPTPAIQRFNDVLSTHFFYEEIEEYVRRGIWDGCGGGNFCPDNTVTREQMARILAKAFNW